MWTFESYSTILMIMLLAISSSHVTYICEVPEHCVCIRLPDGGYNVSCRKAGLTAIPYNLPITTRILDLSQNSISRITSHDLTRTTAIVSLNVSHNRITNISHHSFDGMTMLKLLDLSNNEISDVTGVFKHTYALETLILNSNNIKRLSTLKDKHPFGELFYMRSLDMSNNSLEFFPKIDFSQTSNLTQLLLNHNNLTNIEINSKSVPDFNTLELSFNKFTNITNTTRTQFDILGMQLQLTLAGNPLLCQCNTLEFVKWILYTDVQIISYENDTFCIYHNTIEDINRIPYLTGHLKRECAITHDYVPLIIGCSGILVSFIAFISGVIVYNYRWKFRYLYHLTKSKYSGYIQERSNSDHEEYIYDFYMSYAEEDQWVISQHFVSNLETKQGLKLCIHERDFIPGKPIEANIINAVQRSKRSVIVLSENYIQDRWCIFDFNMVRMNDIYYGRDSLVILELERLDRALVPREILEAMAVQPCISFPASKEPNDRFWRRLLSVFKS